MVTKPSTTAKSVKKVVAPPGHPTHRSVQRTRNAHGNNRSMAKALSDASVILDHSPSEEIGNVETTVTSTVIVEPTPGLTATISVSEPMEKLLESPSFDTESDTSKSEEIVLELENLEKSPEKEIQNQPSRREIYDSIRTYMQKPDQVNTSQTTPVQNTGGNNGETDFKVKVAAAIVTALGVVGTFVYLISRT